MDANTAPRATSRRRPPRSTRPSLRSGRRQIARIAAAEAMRSQATPSTSTRAKSKTAKDGPEVVEDSAADEVRVRRHGTAGHEESVPAREQFRHSGPKALD